MPRLSGVQSASYKNVNHGSSVMSVTTLPDNCEFEYVPKAGTRPAAVRMIVWEGPRPRFDLCERGREYPSIRDIYEYDIGFKRALSKRRVKVALAQMGR